MAKSIINNNIFFDYVVDLINSSSESRVELPIKGVSMRPTLEESVDRVVLIDVNSSELFVGAIALFKYSGKYLLHRLVKIEGEMLTFRGDNISSSCERVARDAVVALVESIIKGDGRVINCTDKSYQRAVKGYIIRLRLRSIFLRVKRFISKNR